MRKPVFFILLFQFMLSLCFDVYSHSQGNDKLSHHFLPVHEAFRFTGEENNGKATIHIHIANGYYLYRDRLKFRAIDTTTRVGSPLYPSGIEIFDPFQKREMTVFPESSDVVIPYKAAHKKEPMLNISFQGCAHAGLCYPPSAVTIQLSDASSGSKANVEPVNLALSSDRMNIPVVSDSPEKLQHSPKMADKSHNHYLSLLLKQDNLFILLGLFLIAGILLAFTPCVLPMIPILSATLASGGGNRRQTILMTIAYIICMSLTYAIAGILVGIFGATLNLQALVQSPWLVGLFALVFIALSFSMFGFYELQLPAFLRNRIMRTDSKNAEKRKGSLIGAGLMGVCSALVVSPCVTAPLVGALLYISSTQDAVLGGLVLFSLGLGMGIPLFVVGIGLGHWLPERGVWMNKVRYFFGIFMLAIALWLFSRMLSSSMVLVSWGIFALGISVYLFLTIRWKAGDEPLYKRFIPVFSGLLLLVYGFVLMVGGFKGNKTFLEPLASPCHFQQNLKQEISAKFTKVTSPEKAHKLLRQAYKEHRPAVLDFSADWCESCNRMEKEVFDTPRVEEQLSRFTLVRFDITKTDKEQLKMMKDMSVFGAPTLVFYNKNGKESQRHVGELNKDELIELLKKIN